MKEIQRFGLENVYCASSQDRQFSFRMVRITRASTPLKRSATVYNKVKPLPDITSFYHVFVIGNIAPSILNLLRQHKDWYRDIWINVEDDMNLRNYILQVYDEKGIMFPRKHIFYSFIDESSVIVALRVDSGLRAQFNIDDFKYIRFYSNNYFNTLEYNTLSTKHGIKVHSGLLANNTEKVNFQNLINNYTLVGGKAIVYVNGYYTDNLNLNIPDYSYVEFVYDQSILSKEKFVINNLRTFDSIKDNKLKYLIFRNKIVDYIQYEDDNEIYISTDNELVTKGLFYYEHRDYSVRNVTDKDYSLYTNFVNTQASTLSSLTTGSIQDKVVVLITRKIGITKPLVYNSTKLHELYKLPQDVEHDVLSNMNYTIDELRAENLENSDYLKLGSSKLINVTKELCTSAIGYNGIRYYYGNTPNVVPNNAPSIPVPELYQLESYAYEYDATGKLINRNTSVGPIYYPTNSNVKYVEFIKGNTPAHFDKLYSNTETAILRNSECRILSAYFEGIQRISQWEDITISANKFTIVGNNITFSEEEGKKIKIVYLDEPVTYDLELPLVDGTLHFPLYVREDRGLGVQNYPLDIPYLNVEIFINGFRLTHNIGYFMNYPYISICDKMHIDYTKERQNIHIRIHGFTLDKTKINKNEVVGFINNGVLTRNRYYDIREDRVLSIFIKGKLHNRENIIFAEEDNTVRTTSPLNGLPYTVVEHFTSIKEVSGLDTLPFYEKNNTLNDKISNLYNIVFPEPNINPFNVIGDHYYLYSPVVSKIIHDMLDGNIAESIYTNPYNDSTIIELLDERYKVLLALDPIKQNLPYSIVEIHPHIGNANINLNLFMYRFITNVIRILTGNKPERINISGYLTVTV